MSVVDLFSGAGGLGTGFSKFFNVSTAIDWNKDCCLTYQFNHKNTDVKCEDVRNVSFTKKDYEGIIGVIGGPPCFPNGTPIVTFNGEKNIEEIVFGDKVLTHKGRYRTVSKTFERKFTGKLVKIIPKMIKPITVRSTPEHPFLIYNKGWVKAKDINSGDFVGISLQNNNELSPLNLEGCNGFWWLVGLWLADGWKRRGFKPNPKTGKRRRYTILYAINEGTVDYVVKKLKSSFPDVSIHTTKSSGKGIKIYFSNKPFWEFLESFGYGALGKKIPPEVFSISKDNIRSLLNGYVFGDGSILPNDIITITSVNRPLLSSVQQLWAKVYGIVPSVHGPYFYESFNEIEGRKVNAKPIYNIKVHKSNSGAYESAKIEKGFMWVRVGSVSSIDYNGKVYNFEVEEDNSYCLPGITVHNCQDFSVLNKKRNPNSSRANLLHEMIRALEEIQPSFLMMENVYSVPAEKKERFIKLLQKLDYKVVSKVVNAVDYGSVQIRRRWFLTASKKKFVFPGRVNYQRKAKEILTDEISEIKAREETLRAIKNLEAGKWVALPNQSYKVYFVVDPEKPLPAVVNPTKLRYIKPDRSGYLSLSELYSAFDFPENYRFFGTLTSKGQQLANAVPVSLAEKFASSLKEVI